ncbi:MAG TPA: dehydrogenase [Gammaproteobacteria bacterium]|nr:dehydrogenase [Gammaproteobacteria bacterium]
MPEGIVLAGGFGTRLRDAVPDLPKPMAPVNGRPFLEILLANLARKGFGRVILSLGYMAEKITSHFGTQYSGVELSYVVEEQPLGTGGAVRLAMSECREDHFFVFNGDTFLDLEVDDVERRWRNTRNPVIVGREVDDTTRYGALLTENGRVTGFSEKGASGPGLINAGCYVLKQGQLDGFRINTSFSLETDYLEKAVQDRPFELFTTAGQFIDIGVPGDYARAQHELGRYGQC